MFEPYAAYHSSGSPREGTRRPYDVGVAIEKRKGATLAVLDTAALVVVALLAGFLALKVLGWILGTVLFVVKVAVVALVIAVALRAASAIRRR